ncbi:MAG TPA: nucleotidyltransferase domain-containing protein [Syntrophaceae bacterium]|nr:nucleotidyltransferase domain-containing protein [Syntrophaceae bacterium]
MGFKIGLAEKRKERLERELNRLVPEIIRLGVEKIILFGSLSSNEIHKASDIDLVVVQKTKKRFLERLDEFYNYLKPNVAVDIFVYTPEEFNGMKDRNSFIKYALNKGRIIYEK